MVRYEQEEKPMRLLFSSTKLTKPNTICHKFRPLQQKKNSIVKCG
jgi:hypothetical protein